MATPNHVLRADIEITKNDGSRDQAILIIDPGAPGHQFLWIKSTGWRSLMPLTWGAGKAIRKAGDQPSAVGVDERVNGLDIRPMEFFPFWAADYGTCFISDENSTERTVTIHAPDSVPYTLFVATFDKAKMVPLVVKYYRDTLSNLVRIRTDSGHVMVGSRLRPRKTVVRDYTENSTTTLEYAWAVLRSAPDGLINESEFHTSSLPQTLPPS
ncbi:MAG: hypothetical protein ACE5D3_07445 [Candidatus Binatia bacterium]